MTLTTPIVPLQSSNSNLSSCSDSSVDAIPETRSFFEGCSTDSSLEDSSYKWTQHSNGCNIAAQQNGVSTDSELGDRSLERVCSSLDQGTGTSPYSNETDIHFWMPPEPDHLEDDVEDSVANDDDEDYCGDTWSKSTSFSIFGEDGCRSQKLREQNQKAMKEVRNGRFRTLVEQLLKSVGVVSLGKDADNWVDVVSSLSWEAAIFVKPDAAEGKTMDPDGYVKIKCIATGSPGQSRVIKGVVFKKHAAHKHMPTNCKNPRLLLIQGALGLSPRGLSSFESMQQEKDSTKAIIDVIELYHPNLVLVEKTVSRDIQESILAKGITLVLDVKLHRLERVARCTGSPILSSDILFGQELRQCDSFHFEKFVEDHASPVEGGKRPSKTLMFLEGCPTRLGCSILLMGTNSDQLKRIKCVVRCAVVMAYHFILETYFLLDQRTMFSTIPLSDAVDLALKTHELSSTYACDPTCCNGDLGVESDATYAIDVPISNECHEEGSQYVRPALVDNASFSFETCNQSILSGISPLSASFKTLMEENAPLFANSPWSLSPYISFNEKTQVGQGETDIQVDEYDTEPKHSMDEEKENGTAAQDLVSTSILAHEDTQNTNGENDERKDDIKAVLDSESILVLMSCRNSARGIMCDHSHFSHIKFYRNFDVPLGKFLQDNLLNQKLQCKTCGESPESHFYYYAHHKKQLMIQVRHLPGKSLPGETEGKLWMWSCCGKCKLNNGSSKSTKRVLISTAARGLSFGKFLELSFSNPSSFSTISTCGHSLHKDFLYFFGLGPMVAMFKYSKVATYSVVLPPQKLDFGNSMKGDFLKKEFENVYTKGISMFLDIEKSLEEVQPRFLGVSINLQGSMKEFSYVKEMLRQEKCQFEVDIQSAVKNGNEDECVYLRLNKVHLDLLLESFVWDRRLHSLKSSDHLASDAGVIVNGLSRQSHTGTGQLEGDVKDIAIEDGENVDPKVDHNLVKPEEAKDFRMKDIQIEGMRDGTLSSSVAEVVTGPICEEVAVHSNTTSSQHDSVPSFGQVQSDIIYPVANNAGSSALDNHSRGGKSQFRLPFNSENSEFRIWAPFSEIQQEFLTDLRRGYMPKFESINGLGADTAAYKLIYEEGSRLHIPLGEGDLIVSDYEDEFSSIIALALALIKDQPALNLDLEDESRKAKWVDIKTYGHSQVLPRFLSLNASNLSPTISLDSDGNHSPPRMCSEELNVSSWSGGLELMDSLVSGGSVHYEVSMGVGKSSGKRKYSVVCLCASQFRQLRSRWCSSELDYIASLSRCRNWDAKGGKSKSFFAKTLDDRYIIKEIKRTEFASFMKFAANYFEYMYQCYEHGNQTCLAKILGIYQIIIRQPKNGKEIKHDVMVMENLSYGRNISRQYDLKGALHARFTSTENGAAGDVLLDQNFVNDMNVSPLYVSRRSKRNLQRAVWNDCTFLNTINVMDYSLLVGVDEQKRELVCGIIDYLRQYTWDKQLENWVKSSLVVPKNQKPTIISPIDYKKRFRKFIDMHFLSIPENWCSQRSKPCRLCGMGDEESEDQEEDSGGGSGSHLLKSREREQNHNHYGYEEDDDS